MLLALDIGNSNITCGLYNTTENNLDQSRGSTWRLETNPRHTEDEFGLLLLQLLSFHMPKEQAISAVVMASVVPTLTQTLRNAVQKYLELSVLVVSPDLKTGINILYDNPNQVGADRIVDAIAVKHLFGLPACVIDFGTATTFNAVNRNGDYLGGAIATGVKTSAEALFAKAAKLPSVEIVAPPVVIGQNTVHAMQSGLVFGYVALVEGMVARFKKELGDDMKVIATGGLAGVIAGQTNVIDTVAPDLTLDGLKLFWEMNQTEALL